MVITKRPNGIAFGACEQVLVNELRQPHVRPVIDIKLIMRLSIDIRNGNHLYILPPQQPMK